MCGFCWKVALFLPGLLDDIERVRLDPMTQVTEEIFGDSHDAVDVVGHHFWF
jgi:hypothetical protein